MTRLHEVADLLLELERELRALDLWESERPTPAQLASQLPFAIDTLTFPQWLQFIFIERMGLIVSQGSPLPKVSGIKPIAEEYFKQAGLPGDQVILLLERFDLLVGVDPKGL